MWIRYTHNLSYKEVNTDLICDELAKATSICHYMAIFTSLTIPDLFSLILD